MKRERGSTINRVLDRLGTIAGLGKPFSATEINEVLNLPKATAHRFCANFEAQGNLLGTPVPLHCTASGKLYLSILSKKKRTSIVAKLNLTAITGKTITDKDPLLKEVGIIRKNKLSIDDEEYFDGIIAIAVPITGSQGRFYSSLAFQAPIFRLTLADAQQYIPRLRKAA